VQKPAFSFSAFSRTLVLLSCAGFGLGAAAQSSTPATSSPDPWVAEPAVPKNPAGYGESVRVAQYGTPSGSTMNASTGSSRDDSYSLLPYTRRGYVGINLGQPDFRQSCGTGVYGCDNPDLGVSVYTGGLFNDWMGMELGYMHTGNADRAGGSTRARGVSLSLVGRVPMGAVNVFAKGGAIYAQTKVSSGLLSDVSPGKRRGWGASYGAGIGFDLMPTSGVVLEWTRNEMRFPGTDREDVDMVSLGYVHRF
jgi:OmpA-OmpF porin, OOP family